MKKIIAAISICIIILGCVAACSRVKKVDGAEIYTDAGGSTLAVQTKENGEAATNQDGDILIVVTDPNGKPVKDNNGELATEVPDIKEALIIGNRIEFNDYSIEIPSGWSNLESLATATIKKDNSSEIIKILQPEESAAEVQIRYEKMIDTLKKSYPDAKDYTRGLTLNDTTGPLIAVFIPDASGKSVFVGYYIIEHGDNTFVFEISADKDIGEKFDEIEKIIASVKYKK